MKLFYFGSVCAQEVFNKTVEESRVKPSASAQNFEYALMKGFSADESLDVSAVSAESIATYPGGNRIFLRARKDKLTESISTDIVPALNLPFFKQFCHARGASLLLKRWLRENRDCADKCVLVYGIYPSVVKKLQRLCIKYSCKIFTVVTDIPSTMFTYSKNKGLLKRLFGESYRKSAVALQGGFDGYVYLTEAMRDAVAPGKPYTVVETIADTEIFDGVQGETKSEPPALMYAGALYKKYGVDNILDSYEMMKTDSELWLFGSGDYEGEIVERAKRNPRIRFFGRVTREEVLRYEKKATLLLNIRRAEDEYTKYSFPSKMIEYMLSGTPIATTRLEGIPREYDEYSYVTEEQDPEKIAAFLDGILSKGADALSELGASAACFVTNNKNCTVQARVISEFLKEQL